MKLYPLAFLAILLGACSREEAPDGEPGDSGPVDVVPEDVGGSPIVADDFEAPTVASFWREGSRRRYEAGAVAITDDLARSGSSCVRITCREGDIEEIGSDGVAGERAELDSGKHEAVGHTMIYRFSLRIPSSFPIVDNRLVISQWKQIGLEGSPVIGQRFRKGRHYLTIRTLGTSRLADKRKFDLPELVPDRWHDLKYVIRFTPEKSGSVRVWMNGELVVDYKGRTASPDADTRVYHKMGLYRDRWPDPMTIYFDDYALSRSSS